MACAGSGDPRTTVRWALKTRPRPTRKLTMSKLAKLANFKPVKKPMKYGSWSTLPTCSTLFRGFQKRSPSVGGLCGVRRPAHNSEVGLEDSTASYDEVDHVEVGQVGQLQTCDKAYEIRNLVNFANFFRWFFRWASKTCCCVRLI